MSIVTNGQSIFIFTGDAFGTPGLLAKRVDGSGSTAVLGQFLVDGTFARRKDNADALKALGFQIEEDGGVRVS
jgi:hypothetical protein